MQSDAVISVSKLSKRYGSSNVYALKDLTIHVNKGEVYGFLGPNGAGKSTTIRTLLNLIQPSGGKATILGKDIVKDSVDIRRSLGYLSGDFEAYEKMTGKQFLDYMDDLQPLKRKKRVNELADMFKINLHKKIGELSKGNRQKIGIVQAFMHEPEVFILDEPTDGLDPLMQETFYSLVKDLQTKGATLFISSHNLAEVRKMCDRVGIIRDGKLVSESAISELALEASQTFTITFAGKVPFADLKKIKTVKKLKKDGADKVTLHVHGELAPLFSLLSKHKVVTLSTRELNLEEEFMKYYETENRR